MSFYKALKFVFFSRELLNNLAYYAIIPTFILLLLSSIINLELFDWLRWVGFVIAIIFIIFQLIFIISRFYTNLVRYKNQDFSPPLMNYIINRGEVNSALKILAAISLLFSVVSIILASLFFTIRNQDTLILSISILTATNILIAYFSLPTLMNFYQNEEKIVSLLKPSLSLWGKVGIKNLIGIILLSVFFQFSYLIITLLGVLFLLNDFLLVFLFLEGLMTGLLFMFIIEFYPLLYANLWRKYNQA